MMLTRLLLALGLATVPMVHADALGGQIVEAGQTLVSAMMMFVGGPNKVYILDKVEGNKEQINGHPLYASVWDLETKTATPMDVQTNPFCAAGMHLPNGSFAVFGGNNAVGPNGDNSAPGSTPTYDPTYKDFNGTRSIRIITPCDGSIDSPQCAWYDTPNQLEMQSARWYPAAEPLGNGSVLIIGGFSQGGYINRNYPNDDPYTSHTASNPTYELYPYPNPGVAPPTMQFMAKTSGLNSYALTYLMSSGKFFVQANYSTMLFDVDANQETDLPDMPNQIVRVYPASGANAMLPLTVANNYTQTILFCGGIFMADGDWGDFAGPKNNPWEHAASADCQRITPEPADGSPAVYVQDDDMPTGRTMGQFIALPDGKFLVVNGGRNGTAGYGQSTGLTPAGQMPFGESFATEPQGQPAIYDPNAPAGSRWSTAGLATSNIPRLYHSSAILLPDGSVMIAGSNPNIDANFTTIYPTTYTAEYFYPPYFNATTRPQPQGIPSTLTYGGNSFDITIPSSSYAGSANDAADNATVWLSRPGWTTHGMNMGQRMLQLNNTYTVSSDGTLTLHTAQPPPNPNLFQPGPGFVWVTINGIPSNGTHVLVGNGQMGTQPTAAASTLPASIRADSASGTAPGSSNPNSGPASSSSSTSHTGAIIGGVVGGIAVVGILGAIIGICLSRRRRAAAQQAVGSGPYAMSSVGGRMATGGAGMGARGMAGPASSTFLPLQQGNPSQVSLMGAPHTPYKDEFDNGRAGSPYSTNSFDATPRPSTQSNLGPPRY